MSEKVKSILYGVFCLVMSCVWFFFLEDWELLLFHIIPLNNVVAGIIFAVIGVVCLIGAFGNNEDGEKSKEN